MRLNRSSIGQIFARTIIVLTFLVVSTILIASANGYLFDESTFQFEETGVISLSVKPFPVTLSVNEKDKVYNKEDINLTYLLPGQYIIDVSREGYTAWTKTITIQAGEAVIYPWITLFLSDIKPELGTTNQIAALAIAPSPTLPSPDFDIRGNELWVKPVSRTYPLTLTASDYELMGRFSSPIQGAVWYRGRNRLRTHIVFQVENEIRIIDRDGGNDVLLAPLSSAAPSRFIVSEDGGTLIYRDGDAVFQRKLQ